MQTGSSDSETLIGCKSRKTSNVPPYMAPNGGTDRAWLWTQTEKDRHLTDIRNILYLPNRRFFLNF